MSEKLEEELKELQEIYKFVDLSYKKLDDLVEIAIGELKPYLWKKTDYLLTLSGFGAGVGKPVDDKIKGIFGMNFIDRSSKKEIFTPNIPIEIDKKDVIEKAKELGIPDDIIDKMLKGDPRPSFDWYLHRLLTNIANMVIAEKFRENPKFFEEMYERVASVSDDIKELMKSRAKKKLEEVS